MNRNYTNFSKRAWCSLVICSCLAWFALPMKGQTVTVSGLSCKAMSVTGSGTWFATCQHNQAPLTISTSNAVDHSNKASNLFFSGNKIVSGKTRNYLECYNFGGGNLAECYIKISLPNGFRFTSYHIAMKSGGSAGGTGGGTLQFFEVKSNSSTHFNSDANTTTTFASTSSTEQTIYRNSSTKTDMGNTLYFKYIVPNGSNTITQGITFTEFYVSFAPDVNISTIMKPSSTSTTAKDNVSASFPTNKFDYGGYTWKMKDANTWGNYGYNSDGVKEMYAYNQLYQADAYSSDGTKVTSTNPGITALTQGSSLYFGLKNNTYYAECATVAKARSAVLSSNGTTTTETVDGNDIPVGYRIVGANINYALYTTGATTVTDGYTISYSSEGITYYLMNTNGTLSWGNVGDKTYATRWYGNGLTTTGGYIYSKIGTTNYYLARNGSHVSGSNKYYDLTLNSTGSTWTTNSNGLTYTTVNGYYYYLYYNNTLRTSTRQFYTTHTSTSLSYSATTNAYTYTTGGASYPYTLTVYKNDVNQPNLTSVMSTTSVSTTNDSGTIPLTDLNNDAIKFEISGLATGGQALVTVELILQPLNPYISSMNFGYQPADANKAAVTKFVSSYDFNFGDDVKLLLPKSYEDNTLPNGYPIQFSNLLSNYGDNTYYNNTAATGKSRYSFVGSDYYESVRDIYNKKNEVATHNTYTDKVLTLKAGNKPFFYSNIALLNPSPNIYLTINADGSVTTSAGTYPGSGAWNRDPYYKEYLFNENEYEKNGGSIAQRYLTTTPTTYYLFVADETKYNIAPTIKTEHRAYNYYQLTASVSIVDESPTLTWTRLYPNGYYSKGGTQQYDGDFFAGVKVGAVLTASGATAEGYLMAGDIITKMETEMEAGTATNVPKDMAHVLYIDASNLKNVTTVKVNGGTEGDWTYLQNHGSATKGQLAKNALLFLPENTSTNFTNGIAKYAGNSYKACANIVLTDLQPFYSPYEFIVGGDNYATYKRLASGPNGKVSKATLMLPYTLTLVDGEHVNNDGTGSISLYKMTGAANAFTQVTGHEGTDYIASATFQPVSATTSIANEPYYVVVNEYTPTDGSFVATEYGATIKATPSTAIANGRISSATTSSGSVDGTGYTFTNTGTYSGERMDVTTEKVFYFGTDKFLSLQNFTTGYGYVNPFRGYYMYATSSTPAKNFLSQINVDTDDNGDATNITEATAKPVMAVRAGNGYIDVETVDNTHLSIHTLTGQCLRSNTIPGGTRQHIVLPQGIYVVNGVKVVVR
jgi:hypothetical protein